MNINIPWFVTALSGDRVVPDQVLEHAARRLKPLLLRDRVVRVSTRFYNILPDRWRDAVRLQQLRSEAGQHGVARLLDLRLDGGDHLPLLPAFFTE